MTEINKKRLDEHIEGNLGTRNELEIDVKYESGAHERFEIPDKHRHTLLTMIESLENHD